MRLAPAIAVSLAVFAGAYAPLPSAAVSLGRPVTQSSCPNVSASVSTFKGGGVPGLDWLEQVVFDGLGGMWVSRLQRNRVERYDAHGVLGPVVAVPGAGGLAMGPDGWVYVNSQVQPGGVPSVMRFDPRRAHPQRELYQTALAGVNGSAFDDAGNLYVSTEGASPSVLKIRPDHVEDRAWESLASFYGANGLAVSGPNLYAAISFDQRSPIEVVPLADPAAHHTVAQLSVGVVSREPAVYLPPDLGKPLLPKGLDDLVVGPDGQIYVVGFVSGELLKVNPATGRACVLASGFVTPTAVRFASHFGSFSPTRDLFVTEAAGDILRVHLA